MEITTIGCRKMYICEQSKRNTKYSTAQIESKRRDAFCVIYNRWPNNRAKEHVGAKAAVQWKGEKIHIVQMGTNAIGRKMHYVFICLMKSCLHLFSN